MSKQSCYEKFLETRQEPVRLAAALEGFFLEEAAPEQKEAYGTYLKKRIRPAMEVLIEEDDAEKMEQLEQMGWLEGVRIEGFLETARKKKKSASLVWLLRLKDKKNGYRDRDFTL